MKNKIWFGVILFLLVLIGFFVFNQTTDAKKKDIWEYKTRNGTIRNVVNPDEELNKFGNEGWELIAIEPKSDDSLTPIYVFKRKKE